MRYVIRKFVEAKNAKEAARLDKTTLPHEIYVDDRWWEKQAYEMNPKKPDIGFKKK